MAHFDVLNDGIVCIDTEQIRPRMAACYLIGSKGRYGLVETGTSLSVPVILKVLDELGVARDAVDYVMPTHVHLDHAGGAGALLRELPQAKLVIHPRGARHLVDPSQLIAGATVVYGEEFMRRSYGEIVPVPQARVIVADVGPEQDFTLELGSRRLRFIDVQGHARHHYAIWDEASRGWFSGDTFGMSYREFEHDGRDFIIPTTTPVHFDPPAWRISLQRLLEPEPEYVYLTHYGRVRAVRQLANELGAGLAAYERMARAADGRPDRSIVLQQQLMEHHLQELRKRNHPMPEDRVRKLLGASVQINVSGLEVWLDQARR